MEVSGQLHALGKELLVYIELEAGRAPEPVWTLLSRQKPLASAENLTPAIQSVAIPTELPRLLA
jgi:hypothetical protein